MFSHLFLNIDAGTIDWSRAQFALTAIYHWLFVPLTLGLAVIMGIVETKYYKTKDVFWRDAAKFWQKLFGDRRDKVLQDKRCLLARCRKVLAEALWC